MKIASSSSTREPRFEIRALEATTIDDPTDTSDISGLIEIVWIKKGRGIIAIDLERYEIAADSIYCIGAGQLRLLRAGPGTEGYRILFSPQFLSEENPWPSSTTREFAISGRKPVILADDSLKKDMEELTGKMFREFNGSSQLKGQMLKGLLRIVMIDLIRRLGLNPLVPSFSGQSELVTRYLALLEKNLTIRKTISDYAGELCVSANYLNEIVKRHTGFPASYHIQQRKVLEAKRQIVCNGMTMKQVACHLGFDDPAHFSKFFKVYSGMNFKNFKKSLQTFYLF